MTSNQAMPVLTEKLDTHHTSIIEFIKQNFSHLSDNCCIGDNNDNNLDSNNDDEVAGELLFVPGLLKGTEANPMYCYNSQFWDVPKGFNFQQNPTRKVGWEYWLKGKPNNEVLVNNVRKKAAIKPYRKFVDGHLPPKQRNIHSASWKPIFELMESTPGLIIPNNIDQITSEFIDKSFNDATTYNERKSELHLEIEETRF